MTHLLHPRLADCRRLFLRDYEVWINIGVHDFEKKPAGTGALTVPPGGELHLCYRVLLHGAGWDSSRIDAAWRAWSAR